MARVTIDLARLKALPRRLKLVGAALAVEIVILASGYLILDDMMADRVNQVLQLRAGLAGLRQRNELLRSEYSHYPELRRRYDEAMQAGLGNPLDRPELINFAREAADRHRLSGLRYTLALDPGKPEATRRYLIENDQISFEFGALLDDDVSAFWNDIMTQQPGHYRIASLEMERRNDPDAAVLAAVRRGGAPALLTVKLELRWSGIQPNVQGSP